MDHQLPVYQHPGLVIFVDDSQSFMDGLALHLSPNLHLRTFHNPATALEFIRQSYAGLAPLLTDPIRIGYDERSDLLDLRQASIDLAVIYQRATRPERFRIPVVVVVDYFMPQMSGLEFCAQLQDLPCRKILLTGQADEGIAIDAFNRNLIDRFAKKNSPDIARLLEADINALRRRFFLGQTEALRALLARHTYEFLSDPAVSDLVERLCRQYRFIEHYLFPNPEGILFVDVQGKATLMILATEQSLDVQLEIARDQEAPHELLHALQERSLLPFFSDTGGMYLGEIGEDWLQYCLPPQICHGRQDYYWALFEFPSHCMDGHIYPYADFLKQLPG